jgi:hypothetical protein
MAARPVLLDTNGWVALLCEDDAQHTAAVAEWRNVIHNKRGFILTDWILAETGNGLARTRQRREFRGAVHDLLSSPQARFTSISAALRERALELYENRLDKTWGLVDCASFVVMKDEGITDAFTTDRHFEQAGFNCLLPATAP